MNRQRRLLSRVAVRVIYQAGIIEARETSGALGLSLRRIMGRHVLLVLERIVILRAFSRQPLEPPHRLKRGFKVSGQKVLKIRVGAKFTLPAFSLG